MVGHLRVGKAYPGVLELHSGVVESCPVVITEVVDDRYARGSTWFCKGSPWSQSHPRT